MVQIQQKVKPKTNQKKDKRQETYSTSQVKNKQKEAQIIDKEKQLKSSVKIGEVKKELVPATKEFIEYAIDYYTIGVRKLDLIYDRNEELSKEDIAFRREVIHRIIDDIKEIAIRNGYLPNGVIYKILELI